MCDPLLRTMSQTSPLDICMKEIHSSSEQSPAQRILCLMVGMSAFRHRRNNNQAEPDTLYANVSTKSIAIPFTPPTANTLRV